MMESDSFCKSTPERRKEAAGGDTSRSSKLRSLDTFMKMKTNGYATGASQSSIAVMPPLTKTHSIFW